MTDFGTVRTARTSFYILVGSLLAGAVLVNLGATHKMSRYIYLSADIPAFLVIGAVFTGLMIVARRGAWLDGIAAKAPVLAGLRPWHVALAVLVLAALGTQLVYHGYAFSMDEWQTRFQGAAFLAGERAGTFPAEWRDYGRAMFNVFNFWDPETGLIASTYWPGAALLYAGLESVSLGVYMGALTTAGAVVMAAAVTRQLVPDSRSAPLVAALLVATSTQALAGAMTTYAMPVHLFFNLVWMWLFFRDKWWSHALAALVGFYVAGIHQLYAHFVFVIPFMLSLLRPFRPGLLLWYGAAGVAGHYLLLGWGDWAMAGAVAEQGGLMPAEADDSVGSGLAFLASIVKTPSLWHYGSLVANLPRFIAWQSLALIPLLILMRRKSAWTPQLVLVAAAIVTSWLPFPLLNPDQGHGWGYRYLHGVIGNFAILGAAGWAALMRVEEETARRRYGAFVAACFAATVLVLVPLRGVQVEGIVGSYAEATADIEGRDADVVVIDERTIYYGRDLRRNDPFVRNAPMVMTMASLSPEQADRLCEDYRTELFTWEDAERYGLLTFPPEAEPEDERDIADAAVRARFLQPDCKLHAKGHSLLALTR